MHPVTVFIERFRAAVSGEAGTRFSDPGGDAGLSCPSWLVTYRDDIPTQRWSPIQVLTGPDMGQRPLTTTMGVHT